MCFGAVSEAVKNNHVRTSDLECIALVIYVTIDMMENWMVDVVSLADNFVYIVRAKTKEPRVDYDVKYSGIVKSRTINKFSGICTNICCNLHIIHT